MRTIVHISDLHFGRVLEAAVEPLVQAINEIHPDIVVVSGDLTSLATKNEFAEAKEFLARLPEPQIVVPGNHDIPMLALFRRMVTPLRSWRNFFSPITEPFFQDEELAIVGLNTARGRAIDNGKISQRQLDRLAKHMAKVDDAKLKVVVLHHPIDQPEGSRKKLVRRANPAMEAFAKCGADLLLSGHRHTHFAESTASRYQIDGYAALIVQAGTAMSTRSRKEPQSFNVIRARRPHIEVERQAWNEDTKCFEASTRSFFKHTKQGWIRESKSEVPKALIAAIK